MPQNTAKVPAATGPWPDGARNPVRSRYRKPGQFAAQGKTREFDLVSKSHANLLRRWSSL
jgi:hypothetical protein